MPEFQEIPNPLIPATSYSVLHNGPPVMVILWHTNILDPRSLPTWVVMMKASKFSQEFALDLDVSFIGLN